MFTGTVQTVIVAGSRSHLPDLQYYYGATYQTFSRFINLFDENLKAPGPWDLNLR
jgi:hypothetical protein